MFLESSRSSLDYGEKEIRQNINTDYYLRKKMTSDTDNKKEK
jgi:hypothetical protein